MDVFIDIFTDYLTTIGGAVVVALITPCPYSPRIYPLR